MRSARRDRDERGAIAVLTALLTIGLALSAGLVVDLGHARAVKGKSQNAADASALAAGNALYQTSETPDFEAAVDAALAYAAENFGVTVGDWGGCDDPGHLPYVPTSMSCISFDKASKPTKVRVRIPRHTVEMAFAGVTGIADVSVTTVARAALDPGGFLECGLCVLGSGALHDLQNGDATIHGGNIHFNGSVSVSNNGLVATDGRITVEANASGPRANYDPDPVTGAPAIEDPLAALTLPPVTQGVTAKTNPCTQGAGIYRGLDLRGMQCDLQPGLYVVHGGTWDLSGNASTRLSGSGVTIYLTCSTGSTPRPCNPNDAGATIDASGNGALAISGPTSGPLQGLTVVYDRNNASTLRLTGNGSAGFTGTIYGASMRLQMNGNGCASMYQSAIVVKDLEMNGNPSCLKASYVPGQNWQPPPKGLRLDQ